MAIVVPSGAGGGGASRRKSLKIKKQNKPALPSVITPCEIRSCTATLFNSLYPRVAQRFRGRAFCIVLWRYMAESQALSGTLLSTMASLNNVWWCVKVQIFPRLKSEFAPLQNGGGAVNLWHCLYFRSIGIDTHNPDQNASVPLELLLFAEVSQKTNKNKSTKNDWTNKQKMIEQTNKKQLQINYKTKMTIETKKQNPIKQNHTKTYRPTMRIREIAIKSHTTRNNQDLKPNRSRNWWSPIRSTKPNRSTKPIKNKIVKQKKSQPKSNKSN